MPELLQADLGLNADCQTISMIVRAVDLKKLAPGALRVRLGYQHGYQEGRLQT